MLFSYFTTIKHNDKTRDLFDMLLPMLTIYQEYVRNHHYSLQVLTECKQAQPFTHLLARLESKSACQGRSLETFLTYPMHQIPRYIITLHELLAHTPHDHVERRSLQHARAQLEELSRQMHDEVSETENLRKNLAVERMIIEGCDILLDVNQVFIRQGTLSQVVGKGRRATLQSRQAFLFSNHLLLTTRAAGGRLHLPPSGRLPLHDALLIEDPSNHDDDDTTSVCSSPGGDNYQGKDFKILVEVKGEQIYAHLGNYTKMSSYYYFLLLAIQLTNEGSITIYEGTSPSSPGAISSVTLVGSPKHVSPEHTVTSTKDSPTRIKDNDRAAALMKDESIELVDQSDEDIKYKEEEQEKHKPKRNEHFKISQRFSEVSISHIQRVRTMSESPRRLQPSSGGGCSAAELRRSERRCTNTSINSERRRHWGGSEPRTSVTSQVSQMQNYRRETSQSKAGVVITSFRQSHRRSSTSTAAAAFAVATSASSNPRSPPANSPTQARRDSVISTAATMRVLNVLR
ncbi:unnamed protein product [Leptidea sinapis]|uniref:DH domain-containing protein n=1 Tax=Leptidea sinapis TaxID=189913 RepID=A0A5E4R8G2_9NEOP|nr:unnamed protein product [Leptidea sinapis]